MKTITREELKKKMDWGETSSCWRCSGRLLTGGRTCRVRSGSKIRTGPPSSCRTGARRSSPTARTSTDTPRRGSSVS
jgi:hypothetical protein